MPLFSIDPQYCQERADQARILAARTRESEAREALLAVAEQYENLAERVRLPAATRISRTHRRDALPARL
jgi:hypothetical protein